MKNINSDFIKLLQLNDKEKIKEYVFENGKEGKPYCPISFESGDKDDKVEETDQ